IDCKLYHYSTQSGVEPERLAGEKHNRTVSDTHPYITRNPDKCILCGLCVRVCDEAMGVTALGLVDRGFDAIVKPALDQPLQDTTCVSCGMCAAMCPTGALGERSMHKKDVPVKEASEIITCAFCPAHCKVDLRTAGGMATRALPVDGGFLCAVGRYGIVNRFNGGLKGDVFIRPPEDFTPRCKRVLEMAII
ncbi:MAG: 4Fe-4S binding protein, partial [Clostridiales bacterium]|nr:4Fe-4S binding protein [Clostridiales bacterium]